MNELKNIINLFKDSDLSIYTNIDCNYAETDMASLQCISEFVNVPQMLHNNYEMYINENEDRVIFDEAGLDYLEYWR